MKYLLLLFLATRVNIWIISINILTMNLFLREMEPDKIMYETQPQLVRVKNRHNTYTKNKAAAAAAAEDEENGKK